MDTTLKQAKSPVHDPGGRSMVMTAPNPKRSASKEIRLLTEASKRQKLSHSPEKMTKVGGCMRDPSMKVMNTQESGSSDESASKWFNHVNKNVAPSQKGQNRIDDDPPFYMSNQTNCLPNNFVASESDRVFGNISRFDSENEDLRGVIDDLTVENKRLKHLVRHHQRYRRGSPSDVSQQQDKLFEVRMHGLPPEKRRELEFLLKNFASSVHTSVLSKTPSATSPSSSAGQVHNSLKAPRTDSGYASNSNSGHNSSLLLGSQPVQPQTTSKNIKNYLHEIPDTLLPKRNPIMSERAKMALVVRRLEQLFTGRKAAPGEHHQPIQQQEVSTSAAKADQIRDGRSHLKKQPEGSREAHVMPPDSKVNLDAIDMPEPREPRLLSKLLNENTQSDTSGLSRPASPDQRPTRPLDLDIHRAQVAADNIQYIKHLGIYSPDDVPTADGDESHWMYVNLLSSMAQLHTLNVTPEFIRRAIRRLSKHFELSKDGHKVRWTGSAEGTIFAAEDEKAIEVAAISPHDSAEDAGTGGSSKRSKTNSTSYAAVTSDTPSEDKNSGLQTSSDSKQQPLTTSGTSNTNNQSSNLQSSNLTKPTTQSSAFDYKPVVYREKTRDEYEESYLRDSDESLETSSGGSSGLIRALSKSNLNQQNKEEGPITFYTNPFFCSDFSADNMPSNMQPVRPAIIGATLGIAIPDDVAESPLRHHDATYFATEFAPKPYESRSEQDPKLTLSVPELQSLTNAGEDETVPKEMDACGLGGITPEDNFAVDVKTSMARVPAGQDPKLIRQLPFSKRNYAQRYRYRIAESRKIALLPSKLPPPSYVFFTSSSDEDSPDLEGEDDEEEEDQDSDESSSVAEDFEPPPPAFLLQFSGSSGDRPFGNEEGENDDSSIDMLAIARQADPRQIAEAERVFMINQPGGTGRAVAGSLAATVGASRSTTSVHEGTSISSASSHHGSLEAEMDVDD